jgi:AmpE protein
MKLIVILICIALVRYINLGNNSERYTWLQRYAITLSGFIKALNESWLLTSIVILPILVIAAFLQHILFFGLFYIFGFLYSIFILWYCLWPVSLEAQLESNIQEVLATNTVSNSRPFTTQLLVEANNHIFAVLFWFMALGPLGAILYRLVAELVRLKGEENAENVILLNKASSILLNLLDWIPARLVGLGYMISGNFSTGFVQWRQYATQGLQSSGELLIATGLAAMNLTATASGDFEEARHILRMIERTLVIWLVIIAIFTLGHWI